MKWHDSEIKSPVVKNNRNEWSGREGDGQRNREFPGDNIDDTSDGYDAQLLERVNIFLGVVVEVVCIRAQKASKKRTKMDRGDIEERSLC